LPPKQFLFDSQKLQSKRHASVKGYVVVVYVIVFQFRSAGWRTDWVSLVFLLSVLENAAACFSVMFVWHMHRVYMVTHSDGNSSQNVKAVLH